MGQWVKGQLVEKGVVSTNESFDVILSHHQVHLEVGWQLLQQLKKEAVPLSLLYMCKRSLTSYSSSKVCV